MMMRWTLFGVVGLGLLACNAGQQDSEDDGSASATEGTPTSSSTDAAPTGSPDTGIDDTTGTDGSGTGDGTGNVDGTPLEACVDGSAIDFMCDPAPRMETAVAGEMVNCVAGTGGDAELFFIFELDATDPDGTVHLLELRLQPPQWGNTNDGDRWVVTFDPPIDLGSGETLPATISGTAVVDNFTIVASFSFLQGLMDTVEITFDTPPTLEQLADGATVSGSLSGVGGEFLVFDGTDDSPDPLDDFMWIVDPTVEATGCFNTAVTLHPLEVGDP
ncbi:MAG: hypothetical protein K0V04_31295 [Deltaproteobacteria bacterium]|nr:hypothetical protein [Deltaproteobacteria bacterium]